MNQEYFEKISDMVKKAQEPLHAIAELNPKKRSCTDLSPLTIVRCSPDFLI